jgi:hypothetical protein
VKILRSHAQPPGAPSFNAVPVMPLETPLTRATAYSAIASAGFALIAAVAVSLRMRRFNITLSLDIEKIEHSESETVVSISAVSRGALPVELDEGVRIWINGTLVPIKAILIDGEAVKYCATIRGHALLKCRLSTRVEDIRRIDVALRDKFCRKTFRTRSNGSPIVKRSWGRRSRRRQTGLRA